MTACKTCESGNKQSLYGWQGPLGVVPYTHERVRGIAVVGIIDGGKGGEDNVTF